MKNESIIIQNVILDMDGVLWHGETPVPGLTRFFEVLENQEIGYVLATNNATKVATQYSEKLERFGVQIPASRILTSAETTALFLRSSYPEFSKVYVVGERGLVLALQAKNFTIIERHGFIDPELRVDAVVVGMTSSACYPQLANAAHLINNGALFIGTNPDVTFPSEIGPLPGAGALLAFLETATDIQPIVIGKPNPTIFREALQRLNGNTSNTVMVGDRINTDIAGAKAAGLGTVLLLSGISTRGEVKKTGIQPDWIFDDLISLTAFLNAQES